jgi:hypothetical protein
MLTTREDTIDGLAVRTTQLPAMRAMKLIHRIGKAMAPLVAAIKGKDGLGPALQGMFQSLPEAEWEALIRELLANTVVEEKVLFHNGSSQNFDTVLGGKIGTVFKLLKLSLEVNFQDFLSDLLASGALGQVKVKSSEALTTSAKSGPVGD